MFEQLAAAVADLTPMERAGIIDGAASARDRRTDDGEYRVARFFAYLAAFLAEVDDEQRQTLDDLERGLS